jgi:DNA-binding transcriptional MerR regulator
MIEAALHEQQALELRLAGMTYKEIGKALGLTAAGTHKAVKRALDDVAEETAEKAEQVRALELERLDKMNKAIWGQVLAGNHGAVDRALRIMERRSSLLGIDAPKKQDLNIGGGGRPVEFIFGTTGTTNQAADTDSPRVRTVRKISRKV